MSISAAQASRFYQEILLHQEVWRIRDSGGFPAPSNGDRERSPDSPMLRIARDWLFSTRTMSFVLPEYPFENIARSGYEISAHRSEDASAEDVER